MEWVPGLVLAKALEKTQRSIRRIALRSGWKFREATCRGGTRREYAVAALPPEVRSKVAVYFEQQQAEEDRRLQQEALSQAQEGELNRRISAAVAPLVAEDREKERVRLQRHEESLVKFHQLPRWQQNYALAKWEVIQAFENFMRENRFPLTTGQELFTREYNLLRVPVEDWVCEIYPEVAFTTLRTWIDQEYKHGMLGLIDCYGYHRKGSGFIDTCPELRKAILGILGHWPHARASQILEALRAQAPQEAQGLEIRTLQRFLKHYKAVENPSGFKFLADPNRWRHEDQVSFGSAFGDICRLNQLWEMDSSPADVMLKEGRYAILGVIDVYSRRLLLLVSRTSRATMVCTLFRWALLTWGVPESIKTDNGKEYIGSHFMRVIHDLKLEHIQCSFRSPEQKPFIEAAFKTFAYGLIELRPDYIGHSVAERKSLQEREAIARRMRQPGEVIQIHATAAELQDFCDDWTEAVYGRNPHSGEGMEGRSPFEVAAAWREPVRKIQDERALDILLAPVPGNRGRRIVRPKGIEIENAWYQSPGLIPYINQQLHCRWDPDNIGKIRVFGGHDLSEFLCEAANPEREGLNISLKEAAVAAHARQKAFIQEANREIKAAMKEIKKADIAQTVIEHRKAEAEKVLMLPHATVPHETLGLWEAAAAVKASERRIHPSVATISPEDREKALRFIEQYEAQEEIEEPKDQYKRLRLQETRTTEEEAWMRNFEQTPEGRGVLKFLQYREEDQEALERERQERSASVG